MIYAYTIFLFIFIGIIPGGEAIPAATSWQWVNDAAKAAADNAEQAKDTAYALSVPWYAWIAGAGGLIIALGKFIPGVGGIVASVAGPLYDMLVHKTIKESEAKQAQLASGFKTMVAILDKLPKDATVEDVKKKLTERLPSDCRDEVNLWITEQEKNKSTT